MYTGAKIYVAGHRGLVGGGIVRRLKKLGFENLCLKTSQEVDLTRQEAVEAFFKAERPEYVFLAAAKVGGIHANATYPADFLYANLMIASNVIKAAADHGTEKLLFLGSSCIYPKFAEQPIKESSLLTGALEPTNDAYALAKIAGLMLCTKYQVQYGKRFISAMPTNLYGPGDNFDPMNSHVIPGMMRRFHEAVKRGDTSVMVWGTGSPRREFLHTDDLAEALVYLMQNYEEPETINVGTGQDLTIAELAQAMALVTGFKGRIEFDPSKPDGTPRKVLNVERIHAKGWKHRIEFMDGLASTYKWAVENGTFG